MSPEELRRQLIDEAVDIEAANLNELQHLRDDLKYIRARVDDAVAKSTQAIADLEAHKKDLERCAAEKQKELEHIKGGFPNGDPIGHVNFHQRLIQKAEEEAKIVKDAKHKVILSVTWASIVFVSMAVWEFIKAQVHK